MEQVGKYNIVRKLATGGMAEVYLAKSDGPLGFAKTLVVKRILPQYSENQEFVEMFFSEAKLAAQLNHPNLVQIFDFGETDGSYFIAMEFIDGPNLRTLIQQARKIGKMLPFGLCARVISAACEGLVYAHEFRDPDTHQPLNLIHRDISPDNLLLSKSGAVKVVDFGIAKAASSSPHTRTGTFKGKVAYLSPEQIRNEAIDLRADIYALGVVFYQLLTGKKPFESKSGSDIGLMHAIVNEPFTPPRSLRPDLPDELARILDKVLAKDRNARYATCRELQFDLERYLAANDGQISAFQLAELAAEFAVPEEPEPSPPPRRGSASRNGNDTRNAPADRTRSEVDEHASAKGDATGVANAGNAAADVRLAVGTQSLGPSVELSPAMRSRGTFGWFALGLVATIGVGAWWLSRTTAQTSVEIRRPEAVATVPLARPEVVAAAPPVSSSSPPAPPTPSAAAQSSAAEVSAAAAPVHRRPHLSHGSSGTLRSSADAPAVPGELEFRIRPFATVWLDGKPLGETPLPSVKVPEGKHSVRLVNQELGKDVNLSYDVKAGEHRIIKYSLAE